MDELKLKLVRQPAEGYSEKLVASNPLEAYNVLKTLIKDLPYEVFYALYLDNDNNVTGFHLVSKGTLDYTSIHARDIFGPAILSVAKKIIVCHNHPTGTATPSDADIKLTESLIEAGSILDIHIVDHIVLGPGENEYVSMRSADICKFRGD